MNDESIWHVKFSLSDDLDIIIAGIEELKKLQTDYKQRSIKNGQEKLDTASSSSGGWSKCADCGKKIPPVVVEFCNNHSDRFQGKHFCKDCQGGY